MKQQRHRGGQRVGIVGEFEERRGEVELLPVEKGFVEVRVIILQHISAIFLWI